jgi:hypothetical protein
LCGYIEDNIADITPSDIIIFPNPTTGKFEVQSSKFKVQSVEIYDVYGKQVFEQKAESRKQNENLTVLLSYDLAVFSAGVYFVKIITDSSVVVRKVVKQ